MPQVQVIQPIQQQPKRLRVAAYARVSSDSSDQLNSLSVQVDYYTHLIQENPNWDFAGIYADEGIPAPAPNTVSSSTVCWMTAAQD